MTGHEGKCFGLNHGQVGVFLDLRKVAGLLSRSGELLLPQDRMAQNSTVPTQGK